MHKIDTSFRVGEAKVASKRDKISSRETIRSSLFVRKNDFRSTYLFALPANTAVCFFCSAPLGTFRQRNASYKLLFVLTLFLCTRWCKREFRTCWPMRGVFRGRWAALLWHLSIGLSYPLCLPTTEANTARELGLPSLHWGGWREAAKLSC